MERRTILAVDDTVENLDVLVELLSEYDVIDAISGEDALQIVKEERVDLILLDIMMPKMDGFEVCKRLKSDPKTQNIPIIFITAKTDEESIEKAYDIGGSDYITKPFLPKELLARVKKELQIVELLQELKKQATTDPLSNLYNRRFFIDNSKKIIELAKRKNETISIIMLDIDHFKQVNDTYGHKIGDDVIKKLASVMKEAQRKSDVIARYGGEEFIILLPDTSYDNAKEVAEKLRKKIEESFITTDTGQKVRFTVSIGVSVVNEEIENNADEATQRADTALYRAKESGRNKVC